MSASAPITLPSLHELRYAISGLAAYVTLYYGYMCVQVVHKYSARARIKAQLKKDGAAKLPPGGLTKLIHEDAGYMAGERTFLNMLEQMPVFLASFAGYTLLINPVLGGQLAWAYVACRALYYPLYKTPLLKVALSTAPNYCVIGYFTGCLGMLAYGLF